ncbi:E3 ubiquitin-protein ligase RGLG2, partial [Durusdinium trenchii]
MEPKQPRGRALAALLALAGVALGLMSAFVPPPKLPQAPEAMETPAAWEALQDCVEDGLDAAFTAVDDLFSKADDLVGPSLNPQLLPAGGVPMKQENPLTPVIEPLTRLYMRYRTAMFPRCKDCLI